MKKLLTFILVFALLIPSVITSWAEGLPSPKEEVVYGLLSLEGRVNSLYVVNIFNGGAITDFGDYTDIRNMTTTEKLIQNGDKITIDTNASKFYYQGVIENKELPWVIEIKYYLDDKEITATELAGKSGKLRITVAIKENNNIKSTFFDNYALQVSLSLDNKLSSNIIADNATIAEAGGKKQLAYTLLPGNEGNITVTADVRDFEMEAITINGIKLNLGITVDSQEFTGEISELAHAIEELDNGAAELLEGLTQLSTGMEKYIEGIKSFSEGLGQLAYGADMLNTGAGALKEGLLQLTNQNDTLNNGALSIQQATFDSVNGQLVQMGLGLPLLTPENYNTVLSAIPDLAAVKQQLDGIVQFTQGLKKYTEGVSQLGIGASDLAEGSAEFKASSSIISLSANDIFEAGVQLNKGIRSLKEGLAAYKEGTKELRAGTSDIDSEIANRIDEMLSSISGKGDKVVSFVSEKNINVSAVQFVLRTEAISIPEAPRAVVEETSQLNFWQKLLKLFGLYNK